MANYDAIVIGTGGVGSAALYHLARRGARVLGLDRFEPGHDRGSSHGRTRIIRQAYFEHVDYVPLLVRAYQLWEELEATVEMQLYFQVGLVEVGPPEGFVLSGVQRAARQHGLPVEELTAREAQQRWPGLMVPENYGAMFEQRAGFLLVEPCVRKHIEAAVAAGAESRAGVSVQSWRPAGAGVVVETDAGSFTASRLIVTAGAWANDLLTDLGVPLVIRRKPLFWQACDDLRYHRSSGFPTFFYELPQGTFYGFPQIDELGVKVAEHSGGKTVSDPLHVDRTLHTDDQERVAAFVRSCLPGVSARVAAHTVCMYTMSPDEHFIVDRHPEYPQVTFAAGLSGHGFKFTSVLGEVLAELALEGETTQPAGFLSLRRFLQA